MVQMTPAEINDLLRAADVEIRMVLFRVVENSPDKRAILKAARDYQFSPDCSPDDDHSFAIFEFKNRKYFFSFDPDAQDGEHEGDCEKLARVMTVGLAEDAEGFTSQKFFSETDKP